MPMSTELLIVRAFGLAREVAQLDQIIQLGCNISGLVKLLEECFIRSGCQVLEDLTIADRLMVGASSVAPRSLTKEGMYLGVPEKLKTC